MSRDVSDLESAIENAFDPGRFIDYKASWDFVHGLEDVAARVRRLVGQGDAGVAVGLFETFIAGSYEKADEIDDSGGTFGMFVDELFCDWVRARQAARSSPDETAEHLLTWMESDDYGFCHELERELVEVLNVRGLRAFARKVRERLDAAPPDDRSRSGYPRRRWTTALKRVLAAQGDADGYVALAEETALDSHDCDVAAGIHEDRGALDDALAWVERGLAVAATEGYRSAEYDLKKRRRALLPRLGRADEAIAAAWADFERAPSKYTYADLVKLVAEDDRPTWHEKAMVAAQKGDLASSVGLFVETGEVERLAARIDGASDRDLEGMSHYTTEPAAKLLEDAHPALAARVHRALGLRIVNAGKSEYYDAALANFEHARDCYAAAGRQSDWVGLVALVRREHGRKYSFMPGFERLAAGGPAVEPRPSFLERARSRWPRSRS